MTPSEFRKNVLKLCPGARVDMDDCVIGVTAPLDHTWDGDLHEYVAEYRHTIGDPLDKAWRDDAFADLLRRIEFSGAPRACGHVDCDWCNPDNEISREQPSPASAAREKAAVDTASRATAATNLRRE